MNPTPSTPEETPAAEPQSMPAVKPGRFAKWKKFSFGTMAIAILLHLVFGVAAGFWVVAVYLPRQKQFAGTPKTPGPPKEVQHSVQMAKKKNTMSAPAMPKRVTVNSAMSKVALPAMPTMPVSDVSAPTKIAGMGGTGMGTGLGTGGGFGGMGGGGGGPFSLPKIMADRCTPAARLRAMKETGGKETSEVAVVKALKYLEGKQNPDGSWGGAHKGAMTGLALLSFLGHCEIQSPALKKGIDFLIAEANKNGGRLAVSGLGTNPEPYQHGIATYALGEAYSMLPNRKKDIEPALRNAVGIIVGGQKGDGGWAYAYNTSGSDDLSVAGWQMQALKAAHYTNLNIEGVDKAMDKAIKWVQTLQNKGTGKFGYSSANDAVGEHRLTGVGVLALQVWKHSGSAAAQHGVRTIIAEAKLDYKGPDANLYAWYYETQCAINAGGDHWKKWNNVFQDQIVTHQGSDGSWPPAGGKAGWGSGSLGGPDGEVYRTALCTLMLEVYYRYLPSSKSLGGGEASVKF